MSEISENKEQKLEREGNTTENSQEQSSQEQGLQGPVVRLRRFSHRRSCPFSIEGAPNIDYKDVPLLQRFISERGKMVPARLSNVSRKKQRELAKAIKRARYLALLPYIAR